jgi:hypothetical protein
VGSAPWRRSAAGRRRDPSDDRLTGSRESAAAGASILASAGVISIVAGLAAQTSLANVFAGLQLAFTDAIRVDDVVVVEEERGASRRSP